jgi:DNA-binding beta-propeller fold protein YncE
LQSPAEPARDTSLAPVAVTPAPGGKLLYVACAQDRSVLFLDPASRKVLRQVKLPDTPSGLALSEEGARLFVTCASAVGQICELDTAQGKMVGTNPAGHFAGSPLLAPNGKTLFFCNRFDDSVSVRDLAKRSPPIRIAVPRQPIGLAITHDGCKLLIAHHLPEGRSDLGVVCAGVSVVDLATRRLAARLSLPRGSSLLRDIKISPDGQLAAVAHNLARFQLPTTQVDRGWMNNGALTLIDVSTLSVINTVLLDNVDQGAANPWAIGWTADSKTLVVTHAGANNLSVIDVPALLTKLRGLPARPDTSSSIDPYSTSNPAAEVPGDLAFLVGLRTRVRLTGMGPRSLAIVGTQVFVADYFSDSVECVDLHTQHLQAVPIPLAPPAFLSAARRGEMLFNDATLSFQGWQSCASCHSDDGRVDGLNWDLLNDGLGNPKNTKSLVWAHRTPPAMSTGVRDDAPTAVRSGLSHILFAVPREDVASAVDCYLRSLAPLPSPKLVNGRLSQAARRGEALFQSTEAGCTRCHPGALRTDLKAHDVGTSGPFDQGQALFDTPALVELWRTAPFLHDGSCSSLHELVTSHNRDDRHGRTSHLSNAQVDDLVAFLLSL